MHQEETNSTFSILCLFF